MPSGLPETPLQIAFRNTLIAQRTRTAIPLALIRTLAVAGWFMLGITGYWDVHLPSVTGYFAAALAVLAIAVFAPALRGT